MDQAMFRKELASIRKFGYVNPIIVREFREKLQIIDGEHRLRALLHLGYVEEQVTIIEDLSDDDAKQLTVVLNETRGRADPEKLGVLLNDLLERLPKADLLDVLPIEPIAFDKLTGLVEFDWQSLEQPKREGNKWVERTYRMPVDAATVLDSALDTAKDGESIEDWQALELIAADYIAGTSATPRPQRTGRA